MGGEVSFIITAFLATGHREWLAIVNYDSISNIRMVVGNLDVEDRLHFTGIANTLNLEPGVAFIGELVAVAI